ncbi:MAG: hypothetical protein IPP17_18015 [Bacteroidetes bacterium]|nr:hypothetical protein [Bacteroidota bacterium]
MNRIIFEYRQGQQDNGSPDMIEKSTLMKKSPWILAFAFGLIANFLVAQGNAGLDDFGKNFVQAIAEKNQTALEPLMISEEAARATMAATGLDTAEQRLEIERFNAAMPKMKANFDRAYAALMEGLQKEDLSKIKFVSIKKQDESETQLVEKSDLLVRFKIKRKEFVLDIDDCVNTVQGWRFTAKFHLETAE